MTSIPFVAALVAMVLVGRHSDRTGERKLHVAACALAAAVGLAARGRLQGQLWLLVLSFTLSQMAQRALVGVFWAIPPIFLGGTAAAAGIGLSTRSATLAVSSGRRSWARCATQPAATTAGCSCLAAALVVEAWCSCCRCGRPDAQSRSVGRTDHSERKA